MATGINTAACVAGGVYIAIVAGTFAALHGIEGTWAGWQQATCLPDDCFCEAPRAGLLRQPSNTFSNLAFAVTGTYVLAVLPRTHAPASVAPLYTVFALCFAAACLLTGATSGFYHASLTFLGQWMDNMGMFLMLSAPFLYSLCRQLHATAPALLASYAVLNMGVGWAEVRFAAIRREMFGVLVVALLTSELVRYYRTRPPVRLELFALSLGVFLVSFSVWLLDLKKIVCAPDSLLQGHAVWHGLDALALAFLYAYAASEFASGGRAAAALHTAATPKAALLA